MSHASSFSSFLGAFSPRIGSGPSHLANAPESYCVPASCRFAESSVTSNVLLRRQGALETDVIRGLTLRVPSAVVPAEDNVLINPVHPAFGEVEREGPFDPEIDDRLQ